MPHRASGLSPVRALHVVGAMNYGGVETWLLNVLRNRTDAELQIDILVHTTSPCSYDEQVRELGGNIVPCLRPSRPLRYARSLRAILRERGPYDVVHSHVHLFSGWVLRTAFHAGVPTRVAHGHLDTAAADASSGFLRRQYARLMKEWIERYATIRVAASREAAVALFGRSWEVDPRCRILYCGIDLTRFRDPRPDPDADRSSRGRRLVIGHVGRFDEQKNHQFLIRVAAEVMRREPGARLLLVGDGPLRPTIEGQVARMGVGDRVTFAGLRSDIPELMLREMDVFVLPSLFEGLPLVGVEAQSAGLPSLISDTITPEMDIVPGLVRRLPLSAPPSLWADAILAAHKETARLAPRDALPFVERSPFNIQMSVRQLENLYRRRELGVPSLH